MRAEIAGKMSERFALDVSIAGGLAILGAQHLDEAQEVWAGEGERDAINGGAICQGAV